MSKDIKISRFFTIGVHELFGYFIDPNLLKKWSYPEGMTLKEVRIDQRVGGKYHWEHSSPQGTYICEGHFRKFELNSLLRMVDDRIIDPKGNIVQEHIACDVKFTSLAGGSGVEIVVSGFKNDEFASECKRGWEQCLNNLQDLVKDSGIRQFQPESFNRDEIRGL